MTRKHFEALAKMLKEVHKEELSFDGLVSHIADFCEDQNDRFNRDKFFDAIYKD